MDSLQTSNPPHWTNFRFTGDTLEFFKIWIVNVFLTIVTLGIYSPWAKVRTLGYFYGNTWLHDSSFSFLADPIKILKGRVIAVIVLAAYWVCTEIYPAYALWALSTLCLLFPFIMVTAMSFRLRNTGFRNIRFYFHSNYSGAYQIFILPIGIVIVLTAVLYFLYTGTEFFKQVVESGNGEIKKQDFLLSFFMMSVLPVAPYVDYMRRKFILDHTQYGSARCRFLATAGSFYKVYIITFIFFMFLSMILGMVMGLVIIAGIEPGEAQVAPEQIESFMSSFLIGLIFFYAAGFFVLGYFKAEITNITYNNAEIGPLKLNSTLRGRDIGWLYLTNTLAIVFSLGLLIPWSKIRVARYIASRTRFQEDSLDRITAVAQSDKSAVGEEIGDMFDFDFGL